MNVVITGSTRGIGLGLAKEFLKLGHNVLIHGRDRALCENVVSSLKTQYTDRLIHLYSCDVTNYNSMERMCWEANRFFGSVDIWINNAGINQNVKSVADNDLENIDRVIDVNLKGAIYGTQIASRIMSQNGGYIYNMEGYGSNDMMTKNMTFYGTSKRAVTYFTKSAALEMKDTPVKIGLLSPGMVITELLLSSLPEDQNARERVYKFYNILADKPEVVTKFLVKKILKNRKNSASIKWLTTAKASFRFFKSIFIKRDLFSE